MSATEATQAPPEQSLEMTLEDACKLIGMQHGVKIGKEDPILIMVTLHGEFLRRWQRLLEQHNKATVAVMEKVVVSFRDGLAVEAKNFESQVRHLALENITALISQHQKDMVAHAEHVRMTSFIACGVSICFFVMSLGLLGFFHLKTIF